MKERPILMSAPMVRAILAGRKTQTRRIMKMAKRGTGGPPFQIDGKTVCSPYGVPGDRLWVRESWRPRQASTVYYRADSYDYHHDEIRAGGTVPQWRPSIHMPRWASRITLEVVAVRVERLQEITYLESVAEGVIYDRGFEDPRDNYRSLWNVINAKRGRGWDENPWVWVIEFRRTR